jgi:hypothetical protein
MGITMAVVEVLESHMDSIVVQHMKHSSSLEDREHWGKRISGMPEFQEPLVDLAGHLWGLLPTNPMVLVLRSVVCLYPPN